LKVIKCSYYGLSILQGVVTAAASLIEALAQHHPEDYKDCVAFAVTRLSRIVTAMHTDLLVTYGQLDISVFFMILCICNAT